jgi:hypothetical protein
VAILFGCLLERKFGKNRPSQFNKTAGGPTEKPWGLSGENVVAH